MSLYKNETNNHNKHYIRRLLEAIQQKKDR